MKRVGGEVREGESKTVWAREPVGDLSQDATCQTAPTAPGEVPTSKELCRRVLLETMKLPVDSDSAKGSSPSVIVCINGVISFEVILKCIK